MEELHFKQKQTTESTHPKWQIADHRHFSAEEVRCGIRAIRKICNDTDEAIRRRLTEQIVAFGGIRRRETTCP